MKINKSIAIVGICSIFYGGSLIAKDTEETQEVKTEEYRKVVPLSAERLDKSEPEKREWTPVRFSEKERPLARNLKELFGQYPAGWD